MSESEREYPPIDPGTVRQWAALDGQSATSTEHHLTEDADGAPLGVRAVSWEPALVVIPWDRFGWPAKPSPNDEPQDAA